MTTDNTPIETSEREARPWLPSDGYLPSAAVYPPDGTVSPFTVINLGLGKVQMGDAIHDGRLPALWFGTGGKGLGHEEDMNREARDGETLAVVTFANVEGLDVLLDVVQRIRRVSFPDATHPAAAPQPVAQGDWSDAKLRGIASDYFQEAKDWPAAMLCMRHLLMEQSKAASPAGVVGEPVAWSPDLTYPGYSQTRVWANGAPHQKDIDYWRKEGYGITLAYTAPPARQPLSDEQIEQIARGIPRDDLVHDFARAIERAHGIIADRGTEGADRG